MHPELHSKTLLLRAWHAGVDAVGGARVTREAFAREAWTPTHILAAGKAAEAMCAGALEVATTARALVVAKRGAGDVQRDLHDAHRDSHDAQRDLRDAQRDSRDAQRDLRDAHRDSRDAQRDSRDAQRDSRDAQRDSDDAQCKTFAAQLAANPQVRVLRAGHPLPDADSLRAGHAAAEFVGACSRRARLAVLVSGGASALLEVLPRGAALENLRRLNRALLAGGYDIAQINAARMRVSQIKGGKLLRRFRGESARVFAISDVHGDDIAVIGGGIGALNMRAPQLLPETAELVARFFGAEAARELQAREFARGEAGAHAHEGGEISHARNETGVQKLAHEKVVHAREETNAQKHERDEIAHAHDKTHVQKLAQDKSVHAREETNARKHERDEIAHARDETHVQKLAQEKSVHAREETNARKHERDEIAHARDETHVQKLAQEKSAHAREETNARKHERDEIAHAHDKTHAHKPTRAPGFDYRARIIGSNCIARDAAAEFLRAHGCEVVCNEEILYGDVRAVARRLAAVVRGGARGAYVWGGEPGVTLPPKPGVGGRNMSLALLFAAEIRGRRDISALFAGSDGDDAATGAAGALVDGATFDATRGARAAIEFANAGAYLARVAAVFRPGPTGTNVADLAVAIKG